MKNLILWFSHAIRLVKFGRQFVFKILYYIIRESGTINLTRFLYQICLTGKSDENDHLYDQNIEAH